VRRSLSAAVAPLALRRDSLIARFGLIEISHRLETVIAGHAPPEIKNAARLGFNPFGE
jgi:hypothetical protein